MHAKVNEEGPLTPYQLRLFCRRFIKRVRSLRYYQAAGEAEIHPNGLSMALCASGYRRMGTVIRVLRALGCEVEICYRVRWREPEGRRSIHLN